ncbi:hypothetical protein SYNPS1DRAFT_21784 [Syncephalis pseudoplumigaleata]|uniref:G-protein coupled receptors family 2 profile 2 domain-containing protein n=1 Tax=Syncephalis pseudoplumigaleata TaxID=1712513 RepID=A0A4P9Z3A3_9FUNG|nr:hypothetical protein SYNPS1DRAFT_21784 [Syncephalis pseudoplumigaleata]|eukprot:RKP26462.1 hypothetical protein SYNPS1DRAFT_21784 [Syncephalis pseudoplumigaleata]
MHTLPFHKRALTVDDHPAFVAIDEASTTAFIPRESPETGHTVIADERGITVSQARLISHITVPLNTISLLLSLCVVFAYLFARHFRPAYANRVSLRLTVLLAAVDAFYAFFQLMDTFLQNANPQTAWCAFAAWGYVHCTLLSVFLTSAVALNLHIIFLRGHRTTPAYEVLYLLVPMAAALAISLPPLVFQKFAYNNCWYADVKAVSGLVWAWSTLYLWLFVSIGYCAWAVSVVGWRLAMERKRLRRRVRNGLPSNNGVGLGIAQNSSVGTVSPPSAQVISRVVARVVLYPVIPILTQSLNVAVEMDVFVSQHTSFPLIAASFVATSCQGLLNALVFLLDPTVRTGWYHVRLELIKRYYLDHNAHRRGGAPDERGQVGQLREDTGRQGVWQRIAAAFSTLAAPLQRLVRAILRYWVYHFLLVHRDGKVYLTEYDSRPLDETQPSRAKAEEADAEEEEESRDPREGNGSSDKGSPGGIGGIAVVPTSGHGGQPLVLQPQPLRSMSPTAKWKLSRDHELCQDAFYPVDVAARQTISRKTHDLFFLLSGSPRPDSGIEGTIEDEAAHGSMRATRSLPSQRAINNIDNIGNSAGNIKRFNTIQNVETAICITTITTMKLSIALISAVAALGLLSNAAMAMPASKHAKKQAVDESQIEENLGNYLHFRLKDLAAEELERYSRDDTVRILITKTIAELEACPLLKKCTISPNDINRNPRISIAVKQSLAKVGDYKQASYADFVPHYLSAFINAKLANCPITAENWDSPQ